VYCSLFAYGLGLVYLAYGLTAVHLIVSFIFQKFLPMLESMFCSFVMENGAYYVKTIKFVIKTPHIFRINVECQFSGFLLQPVFAAC